MPRCTLLPQPARCGAVHARRPAPHPRPSPGALLRLRRLLEAEAWATWLLPPPHEGTANLVASVAPAARRAAVWALAAHAPRHMLLLARTAPAATCCLPAAPALCAQRWWWRAAPSAGRCW